MGTEVQTVRIPLLKSAWSKELECKTYDCAFVGNFAVLKEINWYGQEKRKWQVTHRPTGRCAGVGFTTKAKAVAYAEWLEKQGARLDIDWKRRGWKQLQKLAGWPKLIQAVKKWRAANGSRPV